MVKGVNKSVIEINNTEDSFVERAILFINPDKMSHPKAQLRQKAAAYLQFADQSLHGVPMQKRKGFLYFAVTAAIAFLLGAGGMYLLLLWLA